MRQFALGLLAGILLLCQLDDLPDVRWAVLLPIFIFLVYRFRSTSIIFAVAVGFLWGLLQAQGLLNPQLASELEKKDLLIQGKVVSIPQVSEKKIRFDFAPEKAIAPTDDIVLPNKVRLSWYRSQAEIHTGEQWQLQVRMKRPHGFMNPGGFDYEGYLFQQGIGATGYVRKSEKNTRLVTAKFGLDHLRESLATKIRLALDGSAVTGLILALVLGIRSDIDPAQWDLFISTGTNHLIAISGLHIGLISGLGFWLGRWIWKRSSRLCLLLPAPKAAAIIASVLALGYAALAGFSIPTQRALIMLSVVMLAVLLGRPVKAATTLSLAFILVLLWDSFAVLSPGFWLSFAAVAIIVWMLGNRRHWKLWQQWAFIQGGLALSLFPLTIWFFQRASLVAPAANFLVVPVVGFLVVPLALFGSLCLFFSPELGAWILQIPATILSGVVWLLQALVNFSWSTISLPQPNIGLLLLALLGIILLLSPRGIPARGVGAILLLPLFINAADQPDAGSFRINFLDVGQGLSVAVQTANHVLVYDVGAKFSEQFNAGEAVVVPFLQNQGIRKIDRLIVSHADNDHRGGLESVLKSLTVDQLFASDPDALKNIKADACHQGQKWTWDGVHFSLLHPPQGWSGDRNNGSCVLRIENASGSVLLTADIEKPAEKALLKYYGDQLQSTVLLIPHHGSKTSSQPEFIDAVDPEIAVLTLGYLNRFGFPKEEVMRRYAERDIKILSTIDTGRLRFDFPATGEIGISSYRSVNSRFWNDPG